MNYVECAKTAFIDLKIIATEDQIEQVAEYFEQDTENSFDSRGDVSFQSNKEVCRCDSLNAEIERLNNIISIFVGSVKERRNCDMVWVNTKNNTVEYK